MLAAERLAEIEAKYGHMVERIVPIELDGETLRLIIYLKDGSNLRVTEQWEGRTLKRYSYYWLTSDNKLKIGWDNAPHHTRLETHPHHKHVGRRENLQPSKETNLEEVMEVILKHCGGTNFCGPVGAKAEGGVRAKEDRKESEGCDKGTS